MMQIEFRCNFNEHYMQVVRTVLTRGWDLALSKRVKMLKEQTPLEQLWCALFS